MRETKGDHFNCTCPHCNHNNVYADEGIPVQKGEIAAFHRICTHCKKTVYYHKELVIRLTAFSEDPLKTPEKSDRKALGEG